MMILGASSSTLIRILCLAIFWSRSGGGICRKNSSHGAVQAFVLQHHSALGATARRPNNHLLLQQRPKGRSASCPSSSDGQNAASANKKQVQQRRQQHSRRAHPAPPGRSNSNNPSIQINKQLVEFGKRKDWQSLLDLLVKEQRNLNNVNFATAMSQLSSIRSFKKSDPQFLALVKVLALIIEKRGMSWIQARELSNIIHAIAKMGLKNQSTEKILNWISLAEVASQFVEKGNSQEVANTAWAFAKLGYDAPELLAEIEHQPSWLVNEGMPQAVANTAWAFAKLGYDAPKLFAEIDQRSSWLVKEGSPQAVSNTAWAFATLGYDAQKLFAEVEQRSSWLVNEGNPQAVANIAWAFATLGYDAPKLFAEINQRSSWLVKEGSPQAVCNTAWAFATLGYDAPKLFAEIEHHSSWLVKEAKPQEVANTAWAFATLGYNAPELFAEIEQRSSWLVNEGYPQAVANTAWASAKLGYDAPKLFAEIGQNIDKIIKDGNSQSISNICYAIAVLGLAKEHETLLKQLWSRALFLFKSNEYIIEEFIQLTQTKIFAQAYGLSLPSFPEKMSGVINQALENQDEQSRSSAEISQLLNETGFNHKVEVAPHASVSAGILAIDIACAEQMIAIEFDGPSHYLKSLRTGEPTNIENGPTRAKRQFLQQLGWTVINLDYRDYIKSQKNANESQWIVETLNAVG